MAHRIVRSPQAKRDIVDILRYTKQHWGSLQAREYGALLGEALVAIAADPKCGKTRGLLRPGILSFHIRQEGRPARHVVFYHVNAEGGVEVVRVLHDAMDFDRHLP